MVAGEPAIVSFNGGTKDNAINRECKAVLVYADHAAAETAAQIARGIIADVTVELEVFDPGFTCTVEIADDAEVEAMDEKSALALIRALRLAPNGVIRRNVATDGSVEVSSNIGVVATSDDEVKIMLSPRSSITSLQNEFKDRLQTLADILGFDAKFEFEYPGWSYAEHSPVRDVFVESYRELFGSELRIESIHAVLEWPVCRGPARPGRHRRGPDALRCPHPGREHGARFCRALLRAAHRRPQAPCRVRVALAAARATC